MGFHSFKTAHKTIRGIEVMQMIRKGQVKGVDKSLEKQISFINEVFGIAS